MQISRRALEDQISKRLREAVAVKHCRMKELTESEWLQHPASKPPRPLPLNAILSAPDETVRLAKVVGKLQGPENGVESDGDTHLLCWVDAQG
jgi:hypothetical protein